MVEQDRLKNDSFDRLPIADVPYLRKLAQEYRDNPELTKEWFFSFALLGCYDAMWGGFNGMAGHIIYRLSDTIEKPEREIMAIYPNSTGSIIMADNKKDDERWDSLEDWREKWKRLHHVIPECTKQLPGGFSLEKAKNTP